MGGGDEDKARDQNIAAANLQAVQDELPDLHVALIGHTGKDESRGARGSNAHLGDVDMLVQISVTGSVRTATINKINDGMDGVLTRFGVVPVTLGNDEDGDAITTAIVADAVPVAASRAGLNRTQTRAMDLLDRVLAEAGEPPPPAGSKYPDGVTVVVPLERWREHCRTGGLSSAGTDVAARQAFRRAVKDLLAARKIDIRDDLVWIVPE